MTIKSGLFVGFLVCYLFMPYVANDPTASRIPVPGPGCDRLWQDPSEMFGAGLEYFQLKSALGEKFTVSGLALHLGLSYWSLNDYQHRPAFSPIVKRLKAFILEQAEKALWDKDTVNGAKFHANVLGMQEKTVIETQNINLNANTDVNLEALSDADITRLIELRAKLALPRNPGSGTGTPAPKQDQELLPGPGTAEAGTISEAP